MNIQPIDLTRPWYASIASTAATVISQTNWLQALNQQSHALSLTNHRGLPVSFVEQSALPESTAYESFISETGCVPTRNNFHDLFNALVWLSFPETKRQLNALQAAQISQAGIGTSRGATRDAATLFDENAALLVVRDTPQGARLVEALRNHQWHAAFLGQRELFGPDAEVWLFGHALMEKLVTPYKAITAHAWVVMTPHEFHLLPHVKKREWLDRHVANQLALLEPDRFSTRCFTPLPVLGVPDWWPQQDQDFYSDATVFRPKITVSDNSAR